MFLVVFPFWRSQLPRFLKIKDKRNMQTAFLNRLLLQFIWLNFSFSDRCACKPHP